MKKQWILMLALALLSGVASAADRVKITVKNSLDVERKGEIVEVPMADLYKKFGARKTFVVTDDNGREITSQITYDGLLIFQADVKAKGSTHYYVREGKPRQYEAKAFGRYVPERADDFAWENDRVAFRCYGPALQQRGEKAYGYDIWNKRTNKMVVDERYAMELDPEVADVCRMLKRRGYDQLAQELYYSVSYHVDHGDGMDCYKVGPTLGAGATALLANGGKDIFYPYCYTHCELLDAGPLRVTVLLTYEEKEFEGQKEKEIRIISLDAGSQLNKVLVGYNGLKRTVPMAVGIVVHDDNPTAYFMNDAEGYMGLEDLGDLLQYKEGYREVLNKDFGQIYVGAVFPDKNVKTEFRKMEGLGGVTGHILGVANYKPKSTFTYYFGAGWSRNTETGFNSLSDWETYLKNYAKLLKNPLKASLSIR